MTARRDIRPRDHDDPKLAEAFRSVQDALDTIPQHALRQIVVTASGTAGTQLPPIELDDDDFLPEVAQVVRVVPLSDPASDIASESRANFVVTTRGKTTTVQLFEPSGLTANERYTLFVELKRGGR